MTVPYVSGGRVKQKARTHDALVDAVRGLLAQGVIPTMESAAEAASISRTTAYRYFPNLRTLLVAAFPHAEERSLLGPDPPRDPIERLDLVAASHTRRILEYEMEMRAALQLSLQSDVPGLADLPMHRGLRIAWIEDALSPLTAEMAAEKLQSLGYGIGATLGIEAFVWLTDVAGLSRDDAAATMRSNASRLLRAAIAENAAPAEP
jgi:AcrR family transcriptional regulator